MCTSDIPKPTLSQKYVKCSLVKTFDNKSEDQNSASSSVDLGQVT